MTKAFFIDSSAWISHVVAPDSNHSKAVEIFESFTFKTRLFTSLFIVDETISKIRKILDQNSASLLYLHLKKLVEKKRLTIFEVGKIELEKAMIILNKYPTPNTFSLTDATNIVLCQKHQIKGLFSFDSDFKKLKLPHFLVLP